MKHILLVFTLCVISASLGASDKTPVLVGGNEDLDACTTLIGIVNDNKPNSTIPVYSSPDDNSSIVAHLKSGAQAMLCDSRGRRWGGVVFGTFDKEGPYECGVTSPMEPRQAYSGKCKSGWVKSSFIQPLAG